MADDDGPLSIDVGSRQRKPQMGKGLLSQARDVATGAEEKQITKKLAKKKPSESETEHPTYKRGGWVRKTGLAKVHAGERVLTRSQAKRYKRYGGKRSSK